MGIFFQFENEPPHLSRKSLAFSAGQFLAGIVFLKFGQ